MANSKPNTPKTTSGRKDPTIMIMLVFSCLFFGGIVGLTAAPAAMSGPIISLICVGLLWFMFKGV